jgi:hypothetical protein
MEGLGTTCVAAFGLVLFTLWTLGVAAARPRNFFRVWIGGTVLALVAFACAIWAIDTYRSLPSVVFRDSLGFAPPPDITFVNSLRHMPTDWDDSYLEFRADEHAINKVRRSGFVPISSSDIIEYGDEPEWWKPPTGPRIRIWATNTNDPSFRDKDFRFFVSHKLLIYDPINERAFFRHRR